jgi:hemerythrin-like metal-binding protein
MTRKIPDQLLTGFILIDRQHELIYEHFDKLLALIDKSERKEEVLEVLDYVEQHTFTNFDFEETAMKAYDYPDRIEHMASHLILRENTRQIRADITTHGVTPQLRGKARETLYDALFRHIAEHDLKMAPFLKDKNPEEYSL